MSVKRDYPESDWTNADKYPFKFSYSFAVDKNGNPIDSKAVLVDGKEFIEKKDMQVLTNIVRLEFVGDSRKIGEWTNKSKSSYANINYRNLKKLTHYKDEGVSLSELIEAFSAPDNIKSLSVNRIKYREDFDISVFSSLKTLYISSPSENLEEIAKLKNLETLEILAVRNYNSLDFLSSLTKLKHLGLDFFTDASLSNPSVFYGLPNIETLRLTDIKELKNIDFVRSMPKLNSLSLSDCPIISIEPLRNNIVLTELCLDRTGNIKDLSALSTLTNLQKLCVINVYDLRMPNLSNLLMLKELCIKDEYLNAIANMTQIESLEVEGCYYSKGKIKNLTGLKKLKIDLDSEDAAGIKAVAGLPNLEELEVFVDDYSYYGNGVTELFASKSVKTLIVQQNTEYLKINFNKLKDNNVLRRLVFDDILIIINHDSQKFGGYATQFLSHFTALEELSIQSNEIQSLDFVANMPNLRFIDIQDNYISDITPLLSCKNLEFVRCKNNPIVNLNLIPENVEVWSE